MSGWRLTIELETELESQEEAAQEILGMLFQNYGDRPWEIGIWERIDDKSKALHGI